MLGQERYKGRISAEGGKICQKWPFFAFFQTIFCDKIFFVEDIRTKLLKSVKD